MQQGQLTADTVHRRHPLQASKEQPETKIVRLEVHVHCAQLEVRSFVGHSCQLTIQTRDMHSIDKDNEGRSAASLSNLFGMLQASVGKKSFAKVALEDLSATRISSPDKTVGEKVVVKCGGLQVRLHV